MQDDINYEYIIAISYKPQHILAPAIIYFVETITNERSDCRYTLTEDRDKAKKWHASHTASRAMKVLNDTPRPGTFYVSKVLRKVAFVPMYHCELCGLQIELYQDQHHVDNSWHEPCEYQILDLVANQKDSAKIRVHECRSGNYGLLTLMSFRKILK